MKNYRTIKVLNDNFIEDFKIEPNHYKLFI